MKKAQILSAIALAFALGVVAPVAGLANNASAYSEKTGQATLTDVNNAIAFVENDATYKAYVQIQDAIRAYNSGVTNGTIADLAGDGTYSSDAYAIYTAINTANVPAYKFGYNIQSMVNDANKTKSYKEQIKVYVNGAKTSELYNAYANFLGVLDNNSATDAQLVAAATELRTTLGWTDGTSTYGLGLFSSKADYDNFHPEEAKLSTYRGNTTLLSGIPCYTEAKDIYDAVDDAEEALAKYDNGYKLFMPLLINSGLLKEANADAIKDAVNLQPSDLAYAANNYIIRDTEWENLYKEVQIAKESRVQANSGDNYSIIGDLAATWKSATGNEEALKTVMARMAAYKAPVVNPGDDQNGDDINVRPGNTGVVAGAEGTASTTVSIVAGLATALTALGAGVVVYRNARRSSEN